MEHGAEEFVGGGGAQFGSDLAEALHDGIDGFIERGGASGHADVTGVAEPRGIEFLGTRSICRALKPMSPCTVNAVRNHPKWKKAVVSESGTVVDMLDETLRLTVEDALDKAREGKMPTIFEAKLLFEMRQLLSGGATQRVEVLASSEEEDAVRFFQNARKQTPPGMVLEAEVLPAVGDASVALSTSVPLNSFTHSGDSESPV